MKELNPLYELLANIVHMEYANPQHAIQEIIPGQLKGVIYLFESAGIETEQKEKMKESVMWYIYETGGFLMTSIMGEIIVMNYIYISSFTASRWTQNARVFTWKSGKETKKRKWIIWHWIFNSCKQLFYKL